MCRTLSSCSRRRSIRSVDAWARAGQVTGLSWGCWRWRTLRTLPVPVALTLAPLGQVRGLLHARHVSAPPTPVGAGGHGPRLSCGALTHLCTLLHGPITDVVSTERCLRTLRHSCLPCTRERSASSRVHYTTKNVLISYTTQPLPNTPGRNRIAQRWPTPLLPCSTIRSATQGRCLYWSTLRREVTARAYISSAWYSSTQKWTLSTRLGVSRKPRIKGMPKPTLCSDGCVNTAGAAPQAATLRWRSTRWRSIWGVIRRRDTCAASKTPSKRWAVTPFPLSQPTPLPATNPEPSPEPTPTSARRPTLN